MRIFNPDGSEAEKSETVSAFFQIFKRYGVCDRGESYVLHTKAGETRGDVFKRAGRSHARGHGYPEFVAKEIPVVGFEEIVNEAIFFGDNFYNATCVSLEIQIVC